MINTGKSAKKMGQMSVKEARSIDQDPARVPPHKKPRRYRLTLKYTKTITETCVKEFPNKASMLDFRAGVERLLAEEKAAKDRNSNRIFGWFGGGYKYKMDSVISNKFDAEPEFTEEFIDEQS